MARKIKHLSKLFTATVLLVITLGFSGIAVAGSSGDSDKPFNAGEIIIDHVLDAYSIHIAGDFSVYLPVITYGEGQLDVFSSHHIVYDEPYTAASGITYTLVDGHLQASGPDNAAVSFFDFSITKNVVGLIITVLIMLFIFLSIAKSYKRKPNSPPKGLQSVIEPFIIFIRDDVAKASIGKGSEKFVPFLLSIFFFIWIGNMLGLIPFLGGMNMTGNISVTLVLALFTFIITTINGNKGYWMHLIAPPGVPIWLLPIIIPIEIIGMISKPFVLMLRLFANITAGHIIILSFVCLIFIFNEKNGAGVAWGVSIGSLAFSIFMNVLELLVAFLQAYVFTLLSAIYFGQATEEAHH